LHFYLQVKPLQLISKDIIVRFINKLSRVVQQAQKLNFMGGDEQLESLVQLRNNSKPLKLVCSKYKQFHSACFRAT